LRTSKTILVSALCLAGILASAVSSQTAAPDPAAPAAAAPAPKAAVAPSDSAKPAKTVKAKKSKAAKDSTKTAAAPKDTVKAAAPLKDSVAAAPRVDSAAKDTAKTAATDSTKAPVAAADSAKTPAVAATVDSSAYADTTATKKKRKRVVRETTVNTIDDLKGKYRSPKKALFMSMIVPGLGQAYVGQHWFNYTRGAFYFLTDVALAYGWHYYVVDRQDAQIAKYQKFADENWRQYRYEAVIAKDVDKAPGRNQHRENYCETVQDNSTSKGNSLFLGCKTPTSADYKSFQDEYNDQNWGNDSVAHRRAQFVNPHNFYELIGKENEFVTGWADADENNIFLGDSAYYAMGSDGNPLKDAANRLVLATTPMQQKYIGMRAQANDYARMQAYFLGGMVVNHLVSALDAALTAHYHNKALYQTETNWWDRLHLDSQLAWDGYAPKSMVTASVTF
jgi:hypothetical protein